jgi:tetratricopeptide (TPR) repeat protein
MCNLLAVSALAAAIAGAQDSTSFFSKPQVSGSATDRTKAEMVKAAPEEESLVEESWRKAQATAQPSLESGLLGSSLGKLYLVRGKWPDAERTIEASIQMLLQVRAAEAEFVIPLATLAEAQRRLGKTDRAEQNLRKALRLSEKAFGQIAAQTATCLTYLGRLQFDLGAAEMARRNRERSLAICTSLFGEDAEPCVPNRIDLAESARHAKDYRLATRQLEAAARTLEKQGAPEGMPLSTTLHQLGMLQLKEGKAQTAADNFRRAIELAKNSQGPGSRDAAVMHVQLGRALLALRSFEDAESNIRFGISFLEREVPARIWLQCDAMLIYASLLKKTGRRNEAKLWSKKADRLRKTLDATGQGLRTVGFRELEN